MRCGHVVQVVRSDGFAGVERYIVDTSTELASRGWRVSVIGGDAELMRRELPPDVDYRRAASVIEVGRALRVMGAADIVHAHMTAAEFPAALLKRRARGRLVATRHFAGRRGASRLGRVTAPMIRRRLDRQISISQFVADSIGEPSTVIRNGVRRSVDEAAHTRPVVVVMQRLEREKDTATALHAWARSNLAHDGWRMEIYGRGAEAAALHELSRQLGVDDSVMFKGFTDEPRAVLAGCAILLATAPSEPFGLSVVEGMAESVPVVASSGGAHTETLGPHGMFFAAGDVATCAGHLRRLAESDRMRAELGKELAERFAAEFTIERHVDQLAAAYAELMAGAMS